MKNLRSPARSRVGGKCGGFSLVEILLVLTIIGVVVTILSQGLGKLDRGQRCRAGAEDFLQALREARELAARQGCRTRVVFSAAEGSQQASRSKEEPPPNSFAIYVFKVPVDASQLSTLLTTARPQPSKGGSSAVLSESIAGGAAALPEELVGRWIISPERQTWWHLPDAVKVDGPLLAEYEQRGHAAFAQRHFFEPATRWRAEAKQAKGGWSNRSVFPADYAETPFPRGAPLVLCPMPSSARVYDASAEKLVSARDIWGDLPMSHFSSPQRAGVRDFPLPAVEFTPTGALATSQREPLSIRFHPCVAEQPAYELVIDPRSGRAMMLAP